MNGPKKQAPARKQPPKGSKRSMISAGILSQIGSIGHASDEAGTAVIPEPVDAPGEEVQEKTLVEAKSERVVKTQPPKEQKVAKPQGRPVVKPPCTKITLELPQDLLERIRIAADEKTGGNRTMLIQRILEGKASLV